MKRMLLLLTLLLMLCILPVHAEDTAAAAKRNGKYTYAELDERWKPFFPEEAWGHARFVVDAHWEEHSGFAREYGKSGYTHYPIASIRDDAVRLYLFQLAEDEITLLTGTCADSGLTEANGYVLNSLYYDVIDLGGDEPYYSESIKLSFMREEDPWNIEILFSCEEKNNHDNYRLKLITYQFQTSPKTALRGQIYDYLIISPDDGFLSYSYGYMDEPLSDHLSIPLLGSTKLTEFQLADYPANPDDLLTTAKIDTKTHGNGGKVRLRQQPSKKGKTVLQIPSGAEIEMAEMDSGWCFVKYKGKYGYVMAEYVEGTEAWAE